MAKTHFDQKLLDAGNIGEEAFKKWLDEVGISYVAISQSPDTFAKLFQHTTKRPDFFVLFESIGMIAVDVKRYKPFDKKGKPCWTLKYEEELKTVLTFERLFRIPVWYAYYNDGTKWHWISALKAVEVGVLKRNQTTKEEFLAIEQAECVEISKNDDLGKLFGVRLPSLKGIATFK